MSQAIESAKAALNAELENLKTQAAKIIEALAALDNVNMIDVVAKNEVTKAKRGHKSNTVAAEKAASRPGRKKTKTGTLGKTNIDFFLGLVSTADRSFGQIVHEGISKLGLTDPEDIRKFKQRAAFSIRALVKKGVIKDKGEGRERLFFR